MCLSRCGAAATLTLWCSLMPSTSADQKSAPHSALTCSSCDLMAARLTTTHFLHRCAPRCASLAAWRYLEIEKLRPAFACRQSSPSSGAQGWEVLGVLSAGYSRNIEQLVHCSNESACRERMCSGCMRLWHRECPYCSLLSLHSATWGRFAVHATGQALLMLCLPLQPLDELVITSTAIEPPSLEAIRQLPGLTTLRLQDCQLGCLPHGPYLSSLRR